MDSWDMGGERAWKSTSYQSECMFAYANAHACSGDR